MREVLGGVRVVAVRARSVARSRAFWVDRLGFSLISEEPDGGALVNLGTFRLRIRRADAARPARGGAEFVFRTRNLARTARELDQRGVGYEMNTDPRRGDYLETSDPDGNPVVFAERVP